MYEHRHEPLLPRPLFYKRVLRSICIGFALIAVSLTVGILGYHGFENLPWIDAFLNAAMILSGMGPVSELHNNAAKVFAGCYAIYSGIALITTAAVIFAPVVHRVLHRFHFAEEPRN
jgi:hypothetical protein